MSEKKALVVYYSRTGTTRMVAERTAEMLACDIEEIVDTKDRGGLLGFVIAGKDALLKKLTDIKQIEKDPAAYDIVIVGTPVWASTMSCAVRTYLSRYRETLPEVAFFLTTGGSGIKRASKHMARLCGREPLARLGLTENQVRKEDWSTQVQEFVEQVK